MPCVPCVRARRSCVGACRTLSLTLGLPGARIHVCSGPGGDHFLCAGVWVLSVFARKLSTRCPAFVRRRVGFKSFRILEMLLLCTGVWVLRGFCTLRCYFCAQARAFQEVFVCCDATFVYRHVGFKRYPIWERIFLCTGAWVLRGFCM